MKNLKIKTGSVTRLLKDTAFSLKEIESQNARIQKTKDDPEKDDHDVRKQEEVKRNEHRVKSLVGGVAMMQQLMPNIFDGAVEELYSNGTWRRPERATVEDLVLQGSTEGMQRNYKIRGLVIKMVEEIFMESQKLYESLTENAKPVSDKKCIVLTPIAKAAEATDGDEAPAPPPRMEDIKIFDSVSLKNVYASIKSDAAEKGVSTELTLAALHDFFAKQVGRNIALDGALVNFAPMLPVEISMEI